MREALVEDHLVAEVKALGGIALKFTSPGRRHVQDRLCILPGGNIWFVELKAPRKKPRPGQVRFRALLVSLGCQTAVLDTKEKVDCWISER